MKVRVLFLVGILGTAIARWGYATTLVRLSMEQLSQAATAIVQAHVVSQESHWTPDQTRIVTLTTLALDQELKGHPPATLVVEQPGGTVGNVHVRVPGTVLFRPQAGYILFLEPSTANASRYQLVGMVQGAFRIFQDAFTHEKRVILPLGSLSGPAVQTGRGVATSSPSVPFSEFRERLSTALEEPLQIPRGTAIPVTILATESRGVARVRVLGRTTAALYPNSSTVVPAGSPIEGTAQLTAGKWRIHWTEVSVRGMRVAISASSEEPAGEPLRGRVLIAEVK